MKHKAYFLISPTQELVEKVRRSGSESLCDLAESTLWSNDESDRSVLLRSDVDALVKLLFVDMVKRERSGEVAFRFLFGDMPVTTDSFDSNWGLSRIPLDMTVEDALDDAVQSGSINSMLPSGNERLDEVLLEYQVRAARDKL
jgi:hypothetical protein